MESADVDAARSGVGPGAPSSASVGTIERLPIPPTPPPIRAHRFSPGAPPPPPSRGAILAAVGRSPLASANPVGQLGPAAVVRSASSRTRNVVIGVVLVVFVGFVVTGVIVARAFQNATIVSNLDSGDCVRDFFEQDSDGEFVEVFLVNTTSCDQPHGMEVFATTELLWSSDAYPGLDASFNMGEEWCFSQYDTFVGGDYDTSLYEVWTFVPVEQGWSGGDRTVQCLVGQYDEVTLTTGTLEGIDR